MCKTWDEELHNKNIREREDKTYKIKPNKNLKPKLQLQKYIKFTFAVL